MSDVFDDQFEDVSAVEQLADMVSGRAESQVAAVSKQVSFRIYVTHLSSVDVLAARAGISRNAMVNRLLEVGLSALYSHLSDDVSKEITLASGEACSKLLDGDVETVKE